MSSDSAPEDSPSAKRTRIVNSLLRLNSTPTKTSLKEYVIIDSYRRGFIATGNVAGRVCNALALRNGSVFQITAFSRGNKAYAISICLPHVLDIKMWRR